MTLDTLVIGAGQAGLAAGYHLQRAGMRFTILEASDQPGGSWPGYYDSLHLFSPARFSALPGLPFPGDGDRYPARDEVTAYLRQYAVHFQLPVQTGMRVAHVTRQADAFQVTTADGTVIAARSVIAATGAFNRPYLPALPGQDAFAGQTLHAATYRGPESVRGRRIVVVGGGNSAVQIAVELAQVATVSLATRHPLRFQAQQVRGRDVHWWWHVTGFDRAALGQRIGGVLQTKTVGVILDTGVYQAALAAGQPDRRAMFTAFTPTGVRWADGVEETVDAVIFATGYRPNLAYLAELGALDADGRPRHQAGVSTTVPGLGYVGLEQQRTFASATLRGVGPDAARVVRRLRRELGTTDGRCCWWAPRLGAAA
jgi:putative flavoprotein involved in K+ transport